MPTPHICPCGSGLYTYKTASWCAYCQLELYAEHIDLIKKEKSRGYTLRVKEKEAIRAKVAEWLSKHDLPPARTRGVVASFGDDE